MPVQDNKPPATEAEYHTSVARHFEGEAKKFIAAAIVYERVAAALTGVMVLGAGGFAAFQTSAPAVSTAGLLVSAITAAGAVVTGLRTRRLDAQYTALYALSVEAARNGAVATIRENVKLAEAAKAIPG